MLFDFSKYKIKTYFGNQRALLGCSVRQPGEAFVSAPPHLRATAMFAIRQSIGLKYLLSGSWNTVRPVYRLVHSKRYP
jgi:hypothetical protein